MLTSIWNLTGIISTVIMCVSFPSCIFLNKNFSFSQHTLCYSGTQPQSRFLFNTTLVLVAILQVIFTLAISQHFYLLGQPSAYFLFIIGGVAMILCGLIPTHQNAQLHNQISIALFLH